MKDLVSKKVPGSFFESDLRKRIPEPFSGAVLQRSGDFLALTKPRLNSLVIVTAAIGYYLGAAESLNVARLVETVDDIFDELAPILGNLSGFVSAPAQNDARQVDNRLDKDYEILLDALGFEPASLDAIVSRTGLQTGAVASMLLILELDGRVQQQPGGRYSRRLPGKVK